MTTSVSVSATGCRIRWMREADRSTCFQIDRLWWDSKEDLLLQEEFEDFLRRPDHLRGSLVAEHPIRGVVAWCLFAACAVDDELLLYDLAVHPAWCRRGVARSLIEKLLRFPEERYARGRLVCSVRESNLTAQLFLKACGLRCIGVVPGEFHYPCETAYHFQR